MDDLITSFKEKFQPNETRGARSGEQVSQSDMALPRGADPLQLGGSDTAAASQTAASQPAASQPAASQPVTYKPPTVDDGDNPLFVQPKPTFTKEQETAVRRILDCKDDEMYDILDVEDDCSTADAHKAYKALMLKVHPDKNPHPQAHGAFIKLSKAATALKAGDDYKGEADVGDDGPRPVPESLPEPTAFQKEIYAKATPTMLRLLGEDVDEGVKVEYKNIIATLNNDIKAQNKKDGKSEGDGIIQYEQQLVHIQLMEPFREVFEKLENLGDNPADEREALEKQRDEGVKTLWKVVRMIDMINQAHHYPRSWNAEDFSSAAPGPLPEDVAVYRKNANKTPPPVRGPDTTREGFRIWGVRNAGGKGGHLFVVENGKDWVTNNFLELRSGADLGHDIADRFLEDKKDEGGNIQGKWDLARSEKKVSRKEDARNYKGIKGIASNPIRTKKIGTPPRYPAAYALTEFERQTATGPEGYEHLLSRTALGNVLGAGTADAEIARFYEKRNLTPPWAVAPLALSTGKPRAIDSITQQLGNVSIAATAPSAAIPAAPAAPAVPAVSTTAASPAASPASQPAAPVNTPQPPTGEQLRLTNEVEGLKEQMAAMMELMRKIASTAPEPQRQSNVQNDVVMA